MCSWEAHGLSFGWQSMKPFSLHCKSCTQLKVQAAGNSSLYISHPLPAKCFMVTRNWTSSPNIAILSRIQLFCWIVYSLKLACIRSHTSAPLSSDVWSPQSWTCLRYTPERVIRGLSISLWLLAFSGLRICILVVILKLKTYWDQLLYISTSVTTVWCFIGTDLSGSLGVDQVQQIAAKLQTRFQ